MQSDLPHTLFREKGQLNKEDIDKATQLQEEANRRAMKRREEAERRKREEELSVEDVFNGRLEMEEENKQA